MTTDSTNSIRLMIVAGEASGDAHAAALVRALREATTETKFEFYGSTGAQMRAAGVVSVINADALAILGLWEIGRALPKFWRAFRSLKKAVNMRPPDAAILVDWPDFNFRLAHWLHRRGIPVIYYISPQLWAWRSHRARSIRRDVDLLLSILPFEQEWYAERGIKNVKYVGHPLAGEVSPDYGRNVFCRKNELDPSRPVVALLPGSRHKELTRILPPMLGAAALISESRPEVQFVVVVAPNRDPAEAEGIINSNGYDKRLSESLRLVHHETREALGAADAAAVASGTATMEAAMIGTPLVIVYKESFLNWHTLGRLITAEHYGLVNLIAGRRLATELMQNDLNPQRLATEVLKLLEPERNQAMRTELKAVIEKLGEPGASKRAAEAVIDFVQKR